MLYRSTFTHTHTHAKRNVRSRSLLWCVYLSKYMYQKALLWRRASLSLPVHTVCLPPHHYLINRSTPPTPPLLTAKLLTTLVYKRGGSMCIARLTTITTIITRSSLFLSPALQMKHFIFFIFKYSFFFLNHFVLFFCSLNLSPLLLSGSTPLFQNGDCTRIDYICMSFEIGDSGQVSKFQWIWPLSQRPTPPTLPPPPRCNGNEPWQCPSS